MDADERGLKRKEKQPHFNLRSSASICGSIPISFQSDARRMRAAN
jgi:hypothetical protein